MCESVLWSGTKFKLINTHAQKNFVSRPVVNLIPENPKPNSGLGNGMWHGNVKWQCIFLAGKGCGSP
jgi:hypothetical protein